MSNMLKSVRPKWVTSVDDLPEDCDYAIAMWQYYYPSDIYPTRGFFFIEKDNAGWVSLDDDCTIESAVCVKMIDEPNIYRRDKSHGWHWLPRTFKPKKLKGDDL